MTASWVTISARFLLLHCAAMPVELGPATVRRFAQRLVKIFPDALLVVHVLQRFSEPSFKDSENRRVAQWCSLGKIKRL